MPSDKASIFLDDNIILANSKLLRSLEPGVLKRRGVFETFPCYNRRPVAFAQHFNRLRHGLRVLKIQNPHCEDCYARIIQKLLDRNRLKNARVRISVWKDRGKVHVAVICQKLLLLKPQPSGMRVIVSGKMHRRKEHMPIKSLDYAFFRRAYQEAQGKGFDEAILLNRKGEIVEGARSNVFVIRGQKLYTPSLKSGCLPGIMREIVLKQGSKVGLKPHEVSLKLNGLLEADEAFLTNSIIGIQPLIQFGRTKIPHGPWTRKLSRWYRSAISKI